MRTLSQVYPAYGEAVRAVNDLEAAGVPATDITLISGEKGAGRRAGTGVSEADMRAYAERIKQGGTLVSVRAEEGARVGQIEAILGLLDTMPTADAAGTKGAAAPGTVGATDAAATTTAGPDETIEVARENLVVGKRAVDQGGVRVATQVVETPVEKQVRLRGEQVRVERHPADQPLDTVPAGAFQERVIEARATGEEPVVAKEVRVVEEIVIRKGATDRVETVRDTVRETKVDIEDTTARTARPRTDAPER